MKTYEVVKIPAKTETHCTGKRCDLCGKKGDYEWDAIGFDVNETRLSVTVKQKEGYNCPDGGSGQEWEIDLCPDCFKNRLVPWLISQGAKIEQKEWSW
jgi:hypothetical protein